MNLVQFLREKSVYDLNLPLSITEKLVSVNVIELTKVYAAIRGYKVLGVWSAGSLSDDEIKELSHQVTSLLVERGYVKPTKAARLSTQNSASQASPATPVKGSSVANQPIHTPAEQKKQEAPKVVRREKEANPEIDNGSRETGRSNMTKPVSRDIRQLSNLSKLEEFFSPLLYKVHLIGEVAISQEMLTDLSTGYHHSEPWLKETFNKNRGSKANS